MLYAMMGLLNSCMLSGSPWGAGTYASADGSRQPTPLELEIAETQGRTFYEHGLRLQK